MHDNYDVRVWWRRLIDGWPIYAAMAALLFTFSELWIDAKIKQGVAAGVAAATATPDGSDVKTSVAVLSTQITSLDQQVSKMNDGLDTLNQDIKAVLLHLAGED